MDAPEGDIPQESLQQFPLRLREAGPSCNAGEISTPGASGGSNFESGFRPGGNGWVIIDTIDFRVLDSIVHF